MIPHSSFYEIRCDCFGTKQLALRAAPAGLALSCDKFMLLRRCDPKSPVRASILADDATDDVEMIQMRMEVVTETQGEWSHPWPMSVVASIAVINMKACAGRLAASAKRLAQNPRAALPAERTKQTLDAVEFKANLGVLKVPSIKAKALLDIIA